MVVRFFSPQMDSLKQFLLGKKNRIEKKKSPKLHIARLPDENFPVLVFWLDDSIFLSMVNNAAINMAVQACFWCKVLMLCLDSREWGCQSTGQIHFNFLKGHTTATLTYTATSSVYDFPLVHTLVSMHFLSIQDNSHCDRHVVMSNCDFLMLISLIAGDTEHLHISFSLPLHF